MPPRQWQWPQALGFPPHWILRQVDAHRILVAVARVVGPEKATLPARSQLSHAFQVLRALLVQPLLAALPRNPLRDAVLVGGNQDGRRGRPRTGTPRRARGMLASDNERVVANKAQAAHRPPLHSAAKVRAVTRPGPPPSPARLWGGPTCPGAEAGVRADGDVAVHGLGALALRTDDPQAPPQLGPGNCPRRRAILGAGGEGGGVFLRPRRRVLLAGINVSCWVHLGRGGQLCCSGRRAHNGHSFSAGLVSTRGRCRGRWRYTTCRGWSVERGGEDATAGATRGGVGGGVVRNGGGVVAIGLGLGCDRERAVVGSIPPQTAKAQPQTQHSCKSRLERRQLGCDRSAEATRHLLDCDARRRLHWRFADG